MLTVTEPRHSTPAVTDVHPSPDIHWKREKSSSSSSKVHPLTKLNGGLSRIHSADEDAVSWLTNL